MAEHTEKTSDPNPPNFIHDLIDTDRSEGKHQGRVATRFPPEPNGYLHIGHAKSICLNFGLAKKYGGTCNLRFDDTNPVTEEVEFVDSIQADVRWLGFEWDNLFFASDYFEQLYGWAEQLVKAGKAYVDSRSLDEIRESRGNFYKKGTPSPFRDRSIDENLDLLHRMRAGEFADGAHVLRAKIDMLSPNMNLRDPPMYRIRKAPHHRTGDKWCIYPMYDYAHGECDAIERITHSICTLEFENHRALYDWFVDTIGVPDPPQQIEFARLNIGYTVLSKRKLQILVAEKHVSGWDDPRMPTLAGLRRRGYTPDAIRGFCERIGVARRDGMVDVALLEHELREDLNARALRTMAVLRPLKLVIENFPEGEVEWFDAPNHPEFADRGTRKVPFSRELYVEQDDFREDSPKGWFRLAPGAEVRLRSACLVRCKDVVKDASGAVVELRCTWDPDSRGGMPKDGRKVKGTIHWVSAKHAVDADVRLYDRLFSVENPSEGEEQGTPFTKHLNAASLETLHGAKLEPSLAKATPGTSYQFERLGYFVVDGVDSKPDALVFNRTIGLRDSWAKQEQKGK
ncbi:MAG TPA: glutamine--tRNA ligase/YqeY domain fusion protein [Polyangiaceae bacterium]|jgi:glutaminyl-tRNA synthetase|nr:glutamine--tRNA ligase/YqeY domain fusion protein [Polyangiaceae bacterium]